MMPMTMALALGKAAMRGADLIPHASLSNFHGHWLKEHKSDHFQSKSNMNAEVSRGKSVQMSAAYSEMYLKIN